MSRALETRVGELEKTSKRLTDQVEELTRQLRVLTPVEAAKKHRKPDMTFGKANDRN